MQNTSFFAGESHQRIKNEFCVITSFEAGEQHHWEDSLGRENCLKFFIEGVSVTRRRFCRSLTVTLVAEIKDELACRVDD